MSIELEYLVKKQFALSDNIYNVGDKIEMTEVLAKSLVEAGKLEVHKEEKSFEVKVDTKAISDAISEGLARFVPKTNVPEKKMGFGEFLKGIATKTINISTDASGKYTTTTYVDPAIDTDLLKSSELASRATHIELNGTNNVYKFNVISSLGAVCAVVAESDTMVAHQPVVTQYSFTLVRVNYNYVATEESLEDTGALVGEINAAIPEEFQKFFDNGMINGNGVFTGVATHSQTVRVQPENGQDDFTIIVENIDKMFSSAKNPEKCIWVMSRTAFNEIQKLEDSAGNRIWQGQNGISPSPFGTLKGLPVMVNDSCQKLGVLSDIILADWSKYRFISKGGMRMASSAHIHWYEDQTSFKFNYRCVGGPVGLKLTATDGTLIGDFVVLDTRDSDTQSSSSSSS